MTSSITVFETQFCFFRVYKEHKLVWIGNVCFRFLWPCIVSKLWSQRENQQDATVKMFIINTFSTCFGHHYAHLQENKTCVTARGVLRWFCWMWLVAVVGRCFVGYCSSRTITFTVLAPHNTAPHNRYLHSARTPQHSAPQPLPSQCSHPTTQRPTTATNHVQQNQRSTPRAITHFLVSWRWA